MNRKSASHDNTNGARSAVPSLDPLGTLAAAMNLGGRVMHWGQEVELAQLDAIKAYSARAATAIFPPQRSNGAEGAMSTWDAASQGALAALRESQDRWLRADAELQADILAAVRERTDATLAAFRSVRERASESPTPLPFDPVEAMSRASKSFDDWMAQWSSMFGTRPIAVS